MVSISIISIKTSISIWVSVCSSNWGSSDWGSSNWSVVISYWGWMGICDGGNWSSYLVYIRESCWLKVYVWLGSDFGMNVRFSCDFGMYIGLSSDVFMYIGFGGDIFMYIGFSGNILMDVWLGGNFGV